MQIEHACFSHIGRRANNEDACCALPELGLFAVADGMGGYEGGEVASRMAIDAVVEFVRRNAADDDVTWPYPVDRRLTPEENEVAIAARLAGERIARARRGPLSQMGSTVAVARLRVGSAVLGHVGDSRIYRLRGGALEQLTRDHSLHQELVRAGEEVPRHLSPYGHILTRALGTETAEPEVRVVPLAPGDVLLLCTDGLSNAVPPERLAAHCGADDLSAACRALVGEALACGERDNITVALVRVRAA